ncbi:hypothetical protein Tco_0148907 [Tanacetum coccineum]
MWTITTPPSLAIILLQLFGALPREVLKLTCRSPHADCIMFWRRRLGNVYRFLCYLFRNPFSSTTIGDENPISTLGDTPTSPQGYRNPSDHLGKQKMYFSMLDTYGW